MTVRERTLRRIEESIAAERKLEWEASRPTGRVWHKLRRWGYMVYREITKNDISIRAESLSYYTLFSIFPLLAGVILVLGLFARIGPVDQEFQKALGDGLRSLPDEDRERVVSFVLKFRDYYSQKLNESSFPIAAAAIGAMILVAGKVYYNVEELLNQIWRVSEDRPIHCRIRNFFLCVVILPLSYAIAVSLPALLGHLPGTETISLWLSSGLPALIAFLSLGLLFRYAPNTKVSWKSAFIGAFVTTVGSWIGNFLVSIYFKFGTTTVFGKAAVFPILAFFMYVSWLIFMVGVEVSYLIEREEELGRSLKAHQRSS